jgi:polysaccharide biosynthesis/export protein
LEFREEKMLSFVRTVFFTFVALVSLGGCATSGFTPIEFAQKGNTFNATGEYILAPGDRIGVRVYGSVPTIQVDGEYVVSPSGELGLPLAGFIPASGLTLAELNVIVQRQLSQYLKDPRVSVAIVSQGSFQVHFSGEVKTPGVFQAVSGTTLLQGLSQAGGLGRFANGNFVLIRRTKDGTVQRYKGDFDSVLLGKKPSENLQLERNDYFYFY